MERLVDVKELWYKLITMLRACYEYCIRENYNYSCFLDSYFTNKKERKRQADRDVEITG